MLYCERRAHAGTRSGRKGQVHDTVQEGPAAAASGWALRLGPSRGPGPQLSESGEVTNNEGNSAMSVLQLPEGESADFSQGEVYFIGNATTLIRFGGITILTDPAFLHKGQHVDLGHGIWAQRAALNARGSVLLWRAIGSSDR